MKKVIGTIATSKDGGLSIIGFCPNGEYGYRLNDEYKGGELESVIISSAKMTDDVPGLIPENSQDAKYANAASHIVTIYEDEDGSHKVVIGGFSINGRSIQIDSQMDGNGKLTEMRITKAPIGAGFVYNGGAKK